MSQHEETLCSTPAKTSEDYNYLRVKFSEDALANVRGTMHLHRKVYIEPVKVQRTYLLTAAKLTQRFYMMNDSRPLYFMVPEGSVVLLSEKAKRMIAVEGTHRIVSQDEILRALIAYDPIKTVVPIMTMGEKTIVQIDAKSQKIFDAVKAEEERGKGCNPACFWEW